MPKQTSNIKVQGTIDGITYYQRKGKHFAKEYHRVPKEKLDHSPKFEPFRRNMSEFGAAMVAMSGFREGYESVAGLMFDSTLSNRVSSIFRIMMKRHQGRKGTRPLELLINKDLLEGFELNDSLWLNQVLRIPVEVSVNAERNEVTLKTGAFIPVGVITPPAFATHFELINHVSVLSDYQYDAEQKGYLPADKANNKQFALGVSPLLPISDEPVDALTITAALAPEAPLTATSAVIASFGIRFYEQRGGKNYLLGTGAAMKVKKLF